MSGAGCCGTCGPEAPARWVSGAAETASGPVPRVATRWTWRDTLGAWAVRSGIGRMRYTVPPGLYALGVPKPESPLLVTANYKLSFDHVRRAMDGLDAWVLVLDTKGVNVWCAAGKGTFGTEELVRRLDLCQVAAVVEHKSVVVPQLGAPGVAAHEVSRRSGFRVVYGPVRACDLPAFLRAGMRATPEMRRVRFTLPDRLALAPNELARLFVPAVFVLAVFVTAAGLGRHGYRLTRELALGVAAAVGANYLAGIVLTPALLPWLPGRAFAVKGGIVGAVVGAALVWFGPFGWLGGLSSGLLSVAACSFLGLRFTGSTTYTSASGVRREMGWALPMQGALAVLGLAGWVAARFV